MPEVMDPDDQTGTNTLTASTTFTAPVTPSVAAPAPVPPSGPGPDWRATLPDDLKGDKTLARYKEPVDAFKALIEANKQLSVGPKPPANATPEQMATWRQSQGIPVAPDGYEFPDGLDEKAVETFRGEFHKLGIPAAAARQLADRYVAFEQERLDRMQQGWVQELEETRKAWGEPLWNKRSTAAVRVLEVAAQEAGLNPAEVKQFFDVTRMGDHPILFKLIAALGERYIEDRLITGDAGAGVDARSRIAAIRANPKDPAMDTSHPQHRAAFEELQDLYKLAYGTREYDPGRPEGR